MKKYLLLLNVFCLLFFSIDGFSKVENNISNASDFMMHPQSLSFQENKGQMKDEKGNPVPYVLFKVEAKGINIWLTTTGLTYQFVKGIEKEKRNIESVNKQEEIELEWKRVDMIFKNASIKKENCIAEEGEENKAGQINYYLAHCPDGIFNVKSFQKITIKNIYDGVDWVLYTNSKTNSIKQDFIVHANADLDQLRIIYEGNGKFEAVNNQIHFENNIGELQEGKLFCYQENESNEVLSNYIVKKNESITNSGAGNFIGKSETIPPLFKGGKGDYFSCEVSVNIKNYNKANELIIDPQLIWGTFYGGVTSYDGSHSIAVDNIGNVFITGYLNSTDFPVLNPGSGAYFQNTHAGGNFDMFIMKFSATGIHRWTTYYGGSNDDEGLGICTDPAGNVFVTGYSLSNDFPLANSAGAYYQATNNMDEIVILKFSNNGNRIWSTYYGGNNSGEWGRAICSDAAGNIYITGFTYSSNFPTQNPGTTGIYFQPANSGFKDAFVLKFNNIGARQWATYYGGSADDDAYSITVDLLNNIYIAGATKSTNFPLTNPGGAYFQNTKAGAANTLDAFVVKFNNTNSVVWSTYYGGNLDDVGHSIRTDKAGNVFAAGITKSLNFPCTNPANGAYFQGVTGSSGLDDAFILKFSNSGAINWATYYGGNSDESEAAFDSKTNLTIDSCENVYLAFTTKSSNLVTKAACDGGFYKNAITGYSDLFLAKFSNAGIHLWGTYLGGSGNDFRISIVTDRNNNLIATGEWTGLVMTNTTYPLISHGAGSYYDPTHNGDDDVFIVKFKPTVVSATATFTNSNCCTGTASLNGSGGCTPHQYLWYDNNWNLVANSQTATNLCGGIYHGVLRDSMSCSLGDTASVTIVELGTPPNITTGPALTLGCGTSATGIIYGGSTAPGVSYNWTGPGIITGNTNDTATVNVVGTYTITVTDGNGCTNTATVNVSSNVVLPNVATVNPFTITCTTLSGTISATSSTPPITYNWIGPGIVSGGSTNQPTVNAPGTYTVTVTDGNSCTNTATITVAIDTIAPAVIMGASLTIYCNPNQGIIMAGSSTVGATFLWNGLGIVSGNTNDTAIVNAAGTYTVTVTNPLTGCTKTATVIVASNISPPNLSIITPVTVSSCIAFTDTLNASSTLSGVTYNWSGPGIVSGSSTANAVINALGTYTVTITDPVTGCTNTSTIIVNTSTNLPNVTPGSTLTITSCVAVSGNISASSTTPGVTYNWSGPGIVSGGNTSSPSVNALGTYTVTVTDATTGCTNTTTLLVNSNPVLPTVSSAAITIPCNQPTGILNASSSTSGANYLWSGPGIVSGGNTAIANVNSFGTYTVMITDPVSGCTNTATASVSPVAPATALVSTNVTIQLGENTTLTASGGINYLWFPDSALSSNTGNMVIASPIRTTTYCVEVNDNNGCKDTACVTVTVEIPCPTNESLTVPNAFSPNKDGMNDEFCLQGWTVCLKDFVVIICDRWGEKVYESKDPNFCWDGYYLGSIMDSQVFVYYIKANFIGIDKPVVKKGNISLLR